MGQIIQDVIARVKLLLLLNEHPTFMSCCRRVQSKIEMPEVPI
jgi:hypothetical protein